MNKILLLLFSLVFSCQLIANPGKRLIKFIKQGNTREAQNILVFDNSLNINYKDKEGKTPLIHTVIKCNMPLVIFLIEKDADINVQDNTGQTSLHFASKFGKVDMVIFLLKKGANPLIKSDQGELASQLALVWDLKKIAQILQAAERKQKEKYRDYITKVLKDLKAQKNKDKRKTKKKEKQRGKKEIAEEKRRKIINVAFKNNKIFNRAFKALMIVLGQEDKEKAKEIIDFFKPYSSFISVLNYLLNYYASYTNNIPIISFLLDNGADINSGDSNGNTPLHNASKIINVYSVKFLLAKGAKTNAKNKFENAPIHLLANQYYNITDDNVDDVVQIIEAIREKEAYIIKSGSFLYHPAYAIALFNTKGNVITHKLSKKNQKRVIDALSEVIF